MRQYLTATIQALSQDELDNLVEPYVIKKVKEGDPNPEIRVYSIGHEGKANLHLPGIGNKTFTWIQAAVQWIADRLRIGTAVFDRHDPATNAHEGRVQIGEVIGKSVNKIGDRLSTLAAIHIFPAFKARTLDVASIEAEIEYDHDEYQAWPTQIKNVSGIALSNSGIDNPGFPGATLLGAVQAYVQAFGNEIGANNMNTSDVKQAVKDLGLKPSQIFDGEVLMGDTVVMGKVKEAKADVFNMSERIRGERDKAQAQIVVLENKYADVNKQLQQHTILSKSATVIDAVLSDPNRKFTDKAKTFIKRNLKNFTTTAADEEALKMELGKFVDASAKEYEELAKDIFGVAEDTIQNNSQFKLPAEFLVNPQAPNVPAQQQKQPDIPPTRDALLRGEMNPDTNPLIPRGKADLAAQQT